MSSMSHSNIPCVVSIAGTDPSGGAGIQADIKSISATGSYSASIITALVAQNTKGVQAIEEVSPAFVQQQIDSVFNDLDIHAVKIGMLANLDIIDVIAKALKRLRPPNVVLDPVMFAKGGATLIKQTALDGLKEKLFPLAHLITPNIPEAECLLNQEIRNVSDMEDAAKKLGDNYAVHVLVKGGHLNDVEACDVLYDKDLKTCHYFKAPFINTKNTHGTGCSLSSAIASYLAQGHPLKKALEQAKHYITEALAAADLLSVGKGIGPINHFYFLRSEHAVS